MTIPKNVGEFPPVPQDLLEALDGFFPPNLPVATTTEGMDPVEIARRASRVLGRRDVVEALRGALNHQRSLTPPPSDSQDGALHSVSV